MKKWMTIALAILIVLVSMYLRRKQSYSPKISKKASEPEKAVEPEKPAEPESGSNAEPPKK